MQINIITSVRKGGPYNWGKSLSAILNANGIRSRHVHSLQEVLLSPFYQNADMIHTTLPMAFKLWRKPMVLTVKGDFTVEKYVWKHLYPEAIKKADIVTTPSMFLKQKLGLDHAIIIPNAIFPEDYNITRHEDDSTIRVVTMTKFAFKDKSEGVFNILEILEKAGLVTDKNITYTVMGGGKYLDMVKEKAKRYDVDVKFTGHVGDPKPILSNSDIFAYYSVHDNFPNAILDSMASGLPTLTNKVGAVQEIMEDGYTGYIAENRDDYKDKLFALINDPDLRGRMGVEGRKRVEKEYSWHTLAGKYIAIYESLVH